MSIHPTLRYDDARAAIAFLTSTLGPDPEGNLWSVGTYRPTT